MAHKISNSSKLTKQISSNKLLNVMLLLSFPNISYLYINSFFSPFEVLSLGSMISSVLLTVLNEYLNPPSPACLTVPPSCRASRCVRYQGRSAPPRTSPTPGTRCWPGSGTCPTSRCQSRRRCTSRHRHSHYVSSCALPGGPSA